MDPLQPTEEEKLAAEEQALEERKKKAAKRRDITLKVLIAVGLIILIVIGIILPIEIVPSAVSKLSDSLKETFLGSETKGLTTDKTSVESGQPFNLSWTGIPATAPGNYILTYGCVANVGVALQVSTDQSVSLPCENPYSFSISSSTPRKLGLFITSTATTTQSIHFNLSFQGASSTEQAVGDLSITVAGQTNASSTGTLATTTTGATSTEPVTTEPTTSSTSTSTSTYSAPTQTTTPANPQNTYHYTQPAGKPDLAIKLISIGVGNPVNGTVIPTTQFQSTDTVVLRFEVTNTGGGLSTPWQLSALIPTLDPTKQHYSSIEPALSAGSGIYFTLQFSGLIPGQNPVIISTSVSSVQLSVPLSILPPNQYQYPPVPSVY